MDILEYDDVDPLAVLELNSLGLNYALTPERVALMRRLDPRPFPFFAVYAVEAGRVAAQVGVYRLPMVSTEGPEDVGGMCAVCTHPSFARRGFARLLLDEAHARMRAAGLRFSALGTASYRVAHALYRRLGYADAAISTFAFARVADVRPAARSTPLRAERAGRERLPSADAFFRRAAAGHLGFARRPESFLAMLAATGDLDADDVWLLQAGDDLAGYALARAYAALLMVDDLLLLDPADAPGAVAAIARDALAAYLSVRVTHPSIGAALRQAGYAPGQPGWGTFMLKPLAPGLTCDDARRLFGIGGERFLMSPVDLV